MVIDAPAGILMPGPARSFTDLIVWQRSHQLVLAVYRLTAGFPRTERFGLTSQLRQAAVSIAANIAEGFPRATAADKARLFNIAQGSLDEVRYYLLLARDLQYGDDPTAVALVEEVGRLLDAYRRRVLASGR